MELEEEQKAVRREIAQITVVTEGRISWTECWNMSREDRLNIAEAMTDFQRAMEKAMKNS